MAFFSLTLIQEIWQLVKMASLIFYDFGTMAEVKPIAKDQMIKTFFAVLRKDTDEVVNTLTYMGLIEPCGRYDASQTINCLYFR
jgi:predicted unusual protein kinase regulating ubiquinone biosynthesis (AarF/ABC1/UbiB family)